MYVCMYVCMVYILQWNKHKNSKYDFMWVYCMYLSEFGNWGVYWRLDVCSISVQHDHISFTHKSLRDSYRETSRISGKQQEVF